MQQLCTMRHLNNPARPDPAISGAALWMAATASYVSTRNCWKRKGRTGDDGEPPIGTLALVFRRTRQVSRVPSWLHEGKPILPPRPLFMYTLKKTRNGWGREGKTLAGLGVKTMKECL